MVKLNGAEPSAVHCCSYEGCPNPTSSRQYYEVFPWTRAGGKDWSPLVGQMLCHSCYYQFQRKGSLQRDGRCRRPDQRGGGEGSEQGASSQASRPKKTGQRCSYLKCGNPEQSRRFYRVDEHTQAAGQDWKDLIGMVLCHSCYYQFQRRGTLSRQTARRKKGTGRSKKNRYTEESEGEESSEEDEDEDDFDEESDPADSASESPDARRPVLPSPIQVAGRADTSSVPSPHSALHKGARISYDFEDQDTRFGTVKTQCGSSWTVMWDNGKKSQVQMDESNTSVWRVVAAASGDDGDSASAQASPNPTMPFKKRALTWSSGACGADSPTPVAVSPAAGADKAPSSTGSQVLKGERAGPTVTVEVPEVKSTVLAEMPAATTDAANSPDSCSTNGPLGEAGDGEISPSVGQIKKEAQEGGAYKANEGLVCKAEEDAGGNAYVCGTKRKADDISEATVCSSPVATDADLQAQAEA
mmetsp:Transcript_56072/g.137541  ORF Transcript_56072/g.137541 Transcript_56072/m.137541 type:complete len:470 (-) Transcript_56072:1269-2678(-)